MFDDLAIPPYPYTRAPEQDSQFSEAWIDGRSGLVTYTASGVCPLDPGLCDYDIEPDEAPVIWRDLLTPRNVAIGAAIFAAAPFVVIGLIWCLWMIGLALGWTQ